uniref:Uncharacterized protein n=1 Tax=Ciona intestinalis TaxID=7719 RepID=H2XUX3_CIOIN
IHTKLLKKYPPNKLSHVGLKYSLVFTVIIIFIEIHFVKLSSYFKIGIGISSFRLVSKLILTTVFIFSGRNTKILRLNCFITALWARNWFIFLISETFTSNVVLTEADFTLHARVLAMSVT